MRFITPARRSLSPGIFDRRSLADRALSGSEAGAAALWRIADGRRLREPIDASLPVTGLALRDDGRRVLVAATDGFVRVIDLEDGRELARMASTGDGWFALDPAGRFDGPEASLDDGLWWDANGHRLALGRFGERYFEPGLIAKRLQPGLALQGADVAEFGREGLYLPPEVTLAVEERPPYRADRALTVRVTATDRANGELGEIRLFHSGKRVATLLPDDLEQRGSPRSLSWTGTWRVEPVPGHNGLRAVALGWGGIESEPAVHESGCIDRLRGPPLPAA